MVEKSRINILLLTTCFSLLNSSCVVKIDQFKLVRNSSKQDTKSLLPYAWTLKYGEYKSTVYASDSGEMTIFSNQLGDAVVFENFALREIHRLGRFRHFWQIIPDRDWNWMYKQGQYIGIFRCGGWLNSNSQNTENNQLNDKILKQTCGADYDVSTQNTIILDEQEQVKYMEFYLLGEEQPIELKKA